MIRKSLFWGLTLVLVVALVNLIIRGRQLEKKQAAQSVESVQQSESSPTRVLSPQDLEIVNATTQPGSGRYGVEIRNNGSTTYSHVQLRIQFLDRGGKIASTKTQSVNHVLKPGESLKLADLANGEVPASAAKSRVSILFADISGTK